MDHGVLLVISSSWSVPMLSSPQGGMRKAPLYLVEASQAPRAPILTPGRAQIYLVLPGVEERTLTGQGSASCSHVALDKGLLLWGPLPGLSCEGLRGGISERSEPWL